MLGFNMGTWQIKKVERVDFNSFKWIGYMIHRVFLASYNSARVIGLHGNSTTRM